MQYPEQTVPRPALRIILDEHLAISAVLYGLRYLARRLRDDAERPDFRLLHAMLDYIVEYPERWHHPKENRWLFATLLQRHPPAGKLVAELQREHEEGARLIGSLKAALTRFAQGTEASRQAFVDAVEQYAEFQWAHIRREEEQLLPLAEQVLTAPDWQHITQAFEENDNPLFGIKPRGEAERLYRAILDLAPQSLGAVQATASR